MHKPIGLLMQRNKRRSYGGSVAVFEETKAGRHMAHYIYMIDSRNNLHG